MSIRSLVRRRLACALVIALGAGTSVAWAAPRQDQTSAQLPPPAATIPEPVPLLEAQPAVDAIEESLAEPAAYDIDVPLNTRVLSFVRLLSGRLKGFLEEGLSRGVEFLPMVQDVFRAEGLPLDLAYVPLIESAFKPTALSRAKARGIWQFMRGTGLENGLTHDWYIDERADPEKATRAAAKYLKTLYQTFDGDWHLALASYNGGPGRVQRALRRSGREDFWGISASTRYLPRETRDYVPLVLAAIIIARNPSEYGLDVRPVEQRRFETVILPAALDLRRLSAWIGTPVEEIRGLNPELRQWTTPLGVSNYVLKVPDGTGDILRAHLDQSDPASLTSIDHHTVKKGETLISVAKKLRVTRAELAEANRLSIRAKLQPGQQLIIPRAPALPDGTAVTVAEAGAPAPEVVRASAEVEEAPQAPRVHRVRRGDTLFSVARLYRTTVESLKVWNRLRSDTIKVGQRLTIRAVAAATATS
jgi:membrane-bound lytic murein transglycosylase D